jgi:hypothetical protein
MFNQTSLSVCAVVIAALTTGRPALAAETTPGHTGQAAAEPAVPQRANAAPAAPRPPAENPYRCNPSQDIACTIIRETAQGTLIVTMRQRGHSAVAPTWVVISGAPPSSGPHLGGTVYVVPNSSESAQPVSEQAAAIASNGAPILD